MMVSALLVNTNKKLSCVSLGLVAVTMLSFLALSSLPVSADTDTITTTTINVPVSCTMEGTTNTAHTATLLNGMYSGTDYANGIGTTTLRVFCNDNAGYAIYAIGYTNNEYGNTLLHWNKAVNASDTTNDIDTAIYDSTNPTDSTWSVKLASSTGTYITTIADGTNNDEDYTDWHIIPDEYGKVAYKTSGTDIPVDNTGTGSSITVTYDSYISTTQPAGAYVGQVKYTLVHPYTAPAPLAPLDPSVCPSNSVCYAPNAEDVEGDMSSLGTIAASPTAGKQTKTNNSTSTGFVNISSSNVTSITLIAPNFRREGYGFAGWSTDYVATGTSVIYGPNDSIPKSSLANGGLLLYPVWIAKEANVTMQSFNSTNYSAYNTATNGTVIALEDERDHDTYAVAKLADGKWWMIENLRLDDSATLTIANTHNPLHNVNNNNIVTLKTDYANGTIEDHLAASSSSAWCTSNSAACYDQTMLNTNNTRLSDSNLTAGYNTNSYSSKWYGYGNYYNWYSATAGNGTYSKSSGNVDGDLCPNGWHLPYGGSDTGTGGGNTAGGFYYLNTQMSNDTSTQGSKDWRTFPNNFVYSGLWSSTPEYYYRSLYGYYWSSSAYNNNNAYRLSFSSSSVGPGTNSDLKFFGFSVRCVAGS